jgi:hypothetical protein
VVPGEIKVTPHKAVRGGGYPAGGDSGAASSSQRHVGVERRDPGVGAALRERATQEVAPGQSADVDVMNDRGLRQIVDLAPAGLETTAKLRLLVRDKVSSLVSEVLAEPPLVERGCASHCEIAAVGVLPEATDEGRGAEIEDAEVAKALAAEPRRQFEAGRQ